MDVPAVTAFKKATINTFRHLKSAPHIKDAYLRAVPVTDRGFLLPIGEVHRNDDQLLSRLTRWRNEHVLAYPTQFKATEEGTKAWLANAILGNDGRMLFLVVDAQGNVIGHMGFNNCLNDACSFEIDSVARGVADTHKGLFSEALLALMDWARRTINVETFFLRVFSDNAHAIAFYERNGFVRDKDIPLARHEQDGLISYVESDDPQQAAKTFFRMVWRPIRQTLGQSLILTAGPSISMKEATYAYDAALNGWNRNWSRYLTAFERQFADYVGVKHALATSSCTGSLQIALMALGIGPGDEVIVPDLTWVATAKAVTYAGATPVFADIELDSWNLDVRSVEQKISPRTKAIIPVHLYGHPARMSALMDLARTHGLKIVEDAAPAIGAEWHGQRCGSFGDFAAFSFQGAKLLVTGEGGMLVTNDDALYEKALTVWDQGRNPQRTFWIDSEGVKFKMSNVQAAIGLAQLERADELVEMKRRIFSWYQEGLAGTPFITLNTEVEHARSIYWMSSIRLDEAAPISRDALIARLKALNVDTRPVFPAISQYPIWKTDQQPQVTALRVGRQGVNLPSGVCLSREEVDYVCTSLKEVLRG